jgi:hypothetical protein
MKRIALLLVVAAMGTAIAGTTIAVSSSAGASAGEMPFTFFLTNYELLGDPDNPTGVRYHSNGHPFAKSPNGNKIILRGRGAWDPASRRARGGGSYVIRGRKGAVRAKGTWRVTRFISFKMLPGWWGIPGFVEKGWQGPPGSASFSGFLRVRVRLEDRGKGILRTWCLMPAVPKPGDHVSDGIALRGPRFQFTRYRASERAYPYQGVMFYSP